MGRLQSAGILDAAGNVKQQYRQVLDALAKARNVATLKYTIRESRLFEFIVTFPESKSTPAISILHDNNKLIIEAPASVEEAFTLIDQNVGHSKLASNGFSGKLSVEEALVVFALIDIERAENLHRP